MLQGLRDITAEDGALLCFDEVMTGFRIAKGCAQEHFGVTPDLTTVRRWQPVFSSQSWQAVWLYASCGLLEPACYCSFDMSRRLRWPWLM